MTTCYILQAGTIENPLAVCSWNGPVNSRALYGIRKTMELLLKDHIKNYPFSNSFELWAYIVIDGEQYQFQFGYGGFEGPEGWYCHYTQVAPYYYKISRWILPWR